MNEQQPLKLFVWTGVVGDGVMFALARTVEEARALVLAHTPCVPEKDLAQEPDVYVGPVAVVVYGDC